MLTKMKICKNVWGRFPIELQPPWAPASPRSWSCPPTIVGKKEASLAECVKQFWASLRKKNNLQDPENKQFVMPDKKMAKVLVTERLRCFSMSKFLSAHLS